MKPVGDWFDSELAPGQQLTEIAAFLEARKKELDEIADVLIQITL